MAKKKNEHSKYFERIKMYYDKGLWNKKQVHDAVDKGLITEEEYIEIVGVE